MKARPALTRPGLAKSADRTIKTPSSNVSCLPRVKLCNVIIENVASRWRHRGFGGGYSGVLPKPQASTGLRFYVWSSRSDILRNTDALSLSWWQNHHPPRRFLCTAISGLHATMFAWRSFGDAVEFGEKQMWLQIFAQSWPIVLIHNTMVVGGKKGK